MIRFEKLTRFVKILLDFPKISTKVFVFLQICFKFCINLLINSLTYKNFQNFPKILPCFQIWRHFLLNIGKVMHHRMHGLCRNSDRCRYNSIRREWAPVLGQPLYLIVVPGVPQDFLKISRKSCFNFLKVSSQFF